jgi:hypothetical protein
MKFMALKDKLLPGRPLKSISYHLETGWRVRDSNWTAREEASSFPLKHLEKENSMTLTSGLPGSGARVKLRDSMFQGGDSSHLPASLPSTLTVMT